MLGANAFLKLELQEHRETEIGVEDLGELDGICRKHLRLNELV